jgi:hypothetical protein
LIKKEMRRWDAANCNIGLFVSPLPYKIIPHIWERKLKILEFSYAQEAHA